MADRVILSPAVEADDTPVLHLVKVKLTQLTKRRTGDPVSQSEDGMPAGARVLANGGSPLILTPPHGGSKVVGEMTEEREGSRPGVEAAVVPTGNALPLSREVTHTQRHENTH